VPLKIVQQTQGESGQVQKESLLSDYRQVEGFWMPFALKTLEDKELQDSYEVLEFKFNTGVGDEQFEKP
jgi:outer membrane lipoprotein-sorting protein